MAPPRKKSSGQGREFKIRIPEDIAERIEAKAKAEGRPQNRVIINELAAIPDLERAARLGALVQHMEVTLAKYSGRIVSIDLTEALVAAVDAVLAAEGGGALTAAVEKLRVARAAMKVHEQAQAKGKPAK
jgi:hypothetical protein